MKELGRLFRTLCYDKHTRWARCIPDIEYFLNVTTHLSTGYSPFELHFGIKPLEQIQQIIKFPESESISQDAKIMLARENINRSFQKHARAQKSSSRVALKLGDLVLLHIPRLSDALKKVTRKFFHIYYGPYLITKVLGNNSYQLSEEDDQDRAIGVFNQANLKKYIKRQV